MAKMKAVETMRKEPREDRGKRQYVAVYRNYLGLIDRTSNGEYLAQVWQCRDGKLFSVSRMVFILRRKAAAFIRRSIGPGKSCAAMTPAQHAQRLGWIIRQPGSTVEYLRRLLIQKQFPEGVHKAAVKLNLLLDDDDLKAVAAQGFSDRRRAKLSEVKHWAEVTLLAQLQRARERREAELAGERTT